MSAVAAGAPPRLTATWKTWAPTLVPLALVVPLLVSDQPLHYAWGTSAAIWALWVLSLNIVWGYVGLLSLAQLSLGAMTAYTVAICAREEATGLLVSCALGLAAAVLASLLLSAASTRLSGFYFSIITIVFALTVTTVIANWEYAGRTAGLTVPRSLLPELRVLNYDLQPTSPQGFFLIASACFLILNAAVASLRQRTSGRAMRAVRDDVHLAQSLGIKPSSVRTLAFAISGALAGVAGLLQAWSFQLVVPELYGIDQVLLGVMLLVLAGLGSPYAPALAALVYLVLYEAAPVSGDLRLGILGLAVIAIVLLFPGGIASGIQSAWALAARRVARGVAA